MADHFPLVFRNGMLRKHRRQILYEREKAALPAFQIYAEYRRDANKLKEQIADIKEVYGQHYYTEKEATDETTVNGRYFKMKYELKGVDDNIKGYEYKIRLANRNKESEIMMDKYERHLKKLQEKKEKLESDLAALDADRQIIRDQLIPLENRHFRLNAMYDGLLQGVAEKEKEKREFIMKCPDEGCRGFLSTAYKCGTCAKWTCHSCLEVIGAEKGAAHTCKPDAVESAKMIQKETRPCPKCGSRIYKIDGCDQMWCVMDGCNTAFSWNTGKVVTGTVHNPHYYEWLRRTGGGQMERNLADIPCGGLPGYRDMMPIYDNNHLPHLVLTQVMEIHRRLVEHLDIRLPRYPQTPPAHANKDVNVRYLLKEIDELEWKRQLEFTEARFRRKREIAQILSMAVTAASDILRRACQTAAQISDQKEAAATFQSTTMVELEQLRQFTNDSFKALAKRQHMAVPQLGEDWEWVPVRALYKKASAKGGAARAGEVDATEEED